MYKDVGKRILAVFMSVCMLLGIADFSALSVRAATTSINSARIEFQVNGDSSTSNVPYNGTVPNVSVSVSLGGQTLTAGVDYTLTIHKGSADGTEISTLPSDAGIYYYKATGINASGEGYTGQCVRSFTIAKRNITSNNISFPNLENDSMKIGSGQDGKNEPEIKVSFSDISGDLSGLPLSEYDPDNSQGVDYTYSFSGNDKIGTASVLISGVGNYSGTNVRKNFKIINKSLKDDGVFYSLPDMSMEEGITEYKPNWENQFGNTDMKEGVDFKVTYGGKTTEPGVVYCTITGLGDYAGDVIDGYKDSDASYRIKKDIAQVGGIAIRNNISQKKYTGEEIIPAPGELTITDTNGSVTKTLEEGKDYVLKITNNVNATNDSSLARIEISFDEGERGCYAGSEIETFSISKAQLGSDADITQINDVTYNKQSQTPEFQVKIGEKIIDESNYSTVWSNNQNAGEASLTVTGAESGNLTGSATKKFNINRKSIKDTDVTVSQISGNFDYIHGPHKPNVVVTFAGSELVPGEDYDLAYTNNTAAGPATVQIIGKGNYKDEVTREFTINPKNIADLYSSGTLKVEGYSRDEVYTGAQIRKNNIAITNEIAGQDIIELREGTDFEVSYANNNINVGEVPVVINGIGNYSGSFTIEKAFQIIPKQLTASDVIIGLDTYSTPYTTQKIKPGVTVEHYVAGKPVSLSINTDYGVDYKNNTSVSTETQKAEVIITGSGNFEGTVTKNFTITPMDLGKNKEFLKVDFQDMAGSEGDWYYAFNGSEIEPNFQLMYQNGNIVAGLTSQNDYEYEYIQGTNQGPGTGQIKLTGKGNYGGSCIIEFPIKGDLANTNYTQQVEVKDQIYTGDPIELTNDDLTITYKNLLTGRTDTLILEDDFSLEYIEGTNINVGKVTAKLVPGKNNKYYVSSEVNVEFNILPKDINDEEIVTNFEDHPQYTGNPIVPRLSVVYQNKNSHDITLSQMGVEGTENQNTYDFQIIPNEGNQNNNIQAGNAYITIEARKDENGKYIGNYTGKRIIPFTIDKRDISDDGADTTADMIVDNIVAQNYLLFHNKAVSYRDVTFTYKGRDYLGEPLELRGAKAQDTSGEDEDTSQMPDMLENTDYRISYDKNDALGKATLTITGEGKNFTGSVTREFYVKADLSGEETIKELGEEAGTEQHIEDMRNLDITVNANKVYDGDPQELTNSEIKVKFYGYPLDLNQDYEIQYAEGSNIDATYEKRIPFTIVSKDTEEKPTKCIGQYTTSAEKENESFTIAPKPLDDMTLIEGEYDVTASGIDVKGYTYTGEEIHPEFALEYNKHPLVLGDKPKDPEGGSENGDEGSEREGDTEATFDYYIDGYINAVDVPLFDENMTESDKQALRPAIVVKARENGNYIGTRLIQFNITPQSISGTDVAVRYRWPTGEDADGNITYSWRKLNESYSVEYQGNTVDLRYYPYALDGFMVTFGPDDSYKVLHETNRDEQGNPVRIDYELTYVKNEKPGRATLILNGKGNYDGTKEIEFGITGNLGNGDKWGEGVEIEEIDPQPYTMFPGSQPKPKVTYFGTELKEGEDYELTYQNNVNVARPDSEKPPTVIITGTGDEEGGMVGNASIAFEIVVRDLSIEEDVPVDERIMTLTGPRQWTEGYPYTGLEITPTGLTLRNNGQIVPTSEYNISFENNINGGGPDSENPPYVVISGKYDPITGEGGNYTGSLRFPFTIVGTPLNSSGIQITVEQDNIYTGNPVTPAVTVIQGERTLVEGKEYTVEYANNVNVAKANSTGGPTVTVTGVGNYSGSVTRTFNINRRSIDAYADEFKVVIDQDLRYNGTAQTPLPENVKVYRKVDTPSPSDESESGLLVQGTDYRIVGYSNNIDAGNEAVITLEGMGSYAERHDFHFTILPAELSEEEMSQIEITGMSERTYNTKEQTQKLTVIMDGRELVPETDYEIVYSNNVNAGTATATVSLKGNYSGTRNVQFKILPRNLNDAAITIQEIANMVYTGKPLTPSPKAIYKDDTQGINVTLAAGKDYIVSYSNNTAVGANTAVVTLHGTGNYTGSKNRSFTILGDMGEVTVDPIPTQNYTGKAITPSPVVRHGGRTLEAGKDYTLTYANNVEAGKASITITGTGTEFGGSKVVNFDICRDVSAGLQVVGLVNAYLYTGTPVVPPLGKVTAYGKTLMPEKDYKVTVSNNVNAGTASIQIEGIGYYKGSKTFQFNIVKRSVAQATVSKISTVNFNTKAQKPALTVKYGGITLKEGTDYSLKYSNNKFPGKAIVMITGKGNMTGAKVVNFTIKMPSISGTAKATPSSTTKIKISWKKQDLASGYQIFDNKNKLIKTVKGGTKTSYTVSGLKAGKTYSFKVRYYNETNKRKCYSNFTKTVKTSTKPSTPKITLKSKKSKQATISWKKISGASGYEIYRSTKSKSGFKKIKTITKTSYTNTKLTSKKRYYYKVRAYRTVNGTKIYSSYSTTKYVKIK